MKVLYLIDTLEIGGAEKSLLDIVQRLNNVTPIVCHIYTGSTLVPEFQEQGIRVISLDVLGKYSFFRAVRRVQDVIRAEQPELIHAALFRSDVVARIAGTLEGLPIINTFVSDSYSSHRRAHMNSISLFKHRALRIVDRITAKLATHYAANSEAVKVTNCLALGIDPAVVAVIYRGRDIERFAPPDLTARTASRAQLGVSPPSLVIVSVGRLLPTKGQDDLIRAMPQIRKRHPFAKLILAGDGPHRPVLERLVVEHGLSECVMLLGTRHDIPRILHAADVFVSASHYEGLPGAVVEAMLTGLPIALSDITVHREMVTDGVTGKLFPLHDIAAIAETVVTILDSPALVSEMGARARALSVEFFDIKNVVARHEALYASVLAGASIQ